MAAGKYDSAPRTLLILQLLAAPLFRRRPSQPHPRASLLCFYIRILLLLYFTAAAPAYTSSSPVLAPNMSSCHLPRNLPSQQTPYDCCAPPASYEPRLFRPTSSPSHLRTRRRAHAADPAYAAKLARAYSLMKSLPPDDPRSLTQQANIHCAYCNTVYNQMNSSKLFQIHNSWLFFPFHRWYIFFHERILAKLLAEENDDDDDESFALCFWNYDHPEGATIPWLFSASDVLSDALRDISHGFPATVAIDFSVDTDTRPPQLQLRENDNALYRALIRDASTPLSFYGWPYRHNDLPMEGFGFGTVEAQPHNTLHSWVGNKSAVGWKHMGSFYSSGYDPLFYAHHAEIDRLWELWKAMPDHADIDDDDYRNAEFLFYNEEGELVRVKAGDASNATLLGYEYEQVETPWMDAVPEKRSFAPAQLGANDTLCIVGEKIESSPCSFTVERDAEVSKVTPSLHDHLVLTILYNNTVKRIDVYLNFPKANATTDSGCKEYLTQLSFTHFTFVDESEVGNNTVRLDISERLVDLNLTEESSIVVTLVPRMPVSFVDTSNIVLLSASIENALPYQRWDDPIAYL